MVKGFLWPLPGGSDLPGFGFSVPDGSARVDEVDTRDLEPEQIAGSDAVAAAKGRRESLAERMRRIFWGITRSGAGTIAAIFPLALWAGKARNRAGQPIIPPTRRKHYAGFGSINGAASPFFGKIS